MDGASRFTQRDAVASILITGINIVAGFLIGVLQHGMDLRHALETYTVLTIGDGLVTVIPALMISVSGGLIVTRASSEERLGTDVQQAALRQPATAAAGERRLVVLSRFPGLAHDSVSGDGVGHRERRPGACARTAMRKAEPAAKAAAAPRRTWKPAEGGAAGRRSGAGAGEVRGRRAGVAADQAHRRHSQTTGHRTGIRCSVRCA